MYNISDQLIILPSNKPPSKSLVLDGREAGPPQKKSCGSLDPFSPSPQLAVLRALPLPGNWPKSHDGIAPCLIKSKPFLDPLSLASPVLTAQVRFCCCADFPEATTRSGLLLAPCPAASPLFVLRPGARGGAGGVLRDIAIVDFLWSYGRGESTWAGVKERGG